MTPSIHMPETEAPYVLDAGRSLFTVRASATGLLAAFGHNPTVAVRKITGEASFRPESPEQSSLRFEVDADSLAVTGNVNDKDRREMERAMREEVLETARYPQILFESSSVQAAKLADAMYRMSISGSLTLHGTSCDVKIPCNVTVGEDSLRANGEFAIRQTDYGIRLVSVAGGTLKLKDELKFTFDIVAHRKRDA
jgi:polyisoprenoid-binding protein YceI